MHISISLSSRHFLEDVDMSTMNASFVPDEYFITLINTVGLQVNRSLGLVIWIFGILGNLLNILILSRPTLRLNSCAVLLCFSAVADLFSIVFGLTSRILNAWDLDPAKTQSWLCKGRIFIVFTIRTIALWLFTVKHSTVTQLIKRRRQGDVSADHRYTE